jgi:hypothetical protein
MYEVHRAITNNVVGNVILVTSRVTDITWASRHASYDLIPTPAHASTPSTTEQPKITKR